MPQVIVVGAGIAGLAAAYELARRGVTFLLLESGDRPGGVILSDQVDGFTIDAGPDSLLVQKPEGIKLCEELGLGHRLVSTKPPRLAFILRGGVLHPLPAGSVLGIPTRLGPFVRTHLFSAHGKMRMGAELLIRPRKDQDADESIGAFITRRFGVEASDYLAEPLLAGIHAGDVNRLSVKALFPRFTEAEARHGSLIKAFRRAPRADSTEGPFRSLAGGLSELVRAVADALPAGSVRLASRVERLAMMRPPQGSNGQFRLEMSSGESLTSASVLLATPAFVTAGIIRAFDAGLARLCDEIRYVSTATVAVAFPRRAVAHPLNGTGFVVPKVERTDILAASWLSSKWPGRSPDDRVLMRAFLGGARDPNALELDDESLVQRALSALQPILGITGAPLLTRVYRWQRANAQHEVGHLARMRAIETAVADHPGLFVTGSGFRGVGIPDCIADGRATAARAHDYLAQSEVASAPRQAAR
jgi:oxygen-dependent protoporphyrinogen oxidase